MAEENITLPDISGVLYSRRSSTGKLTSSKGEEKAVPNYLRASTGSCHDFCKFGHKHASEEKERRPFLRRGMGKPPDGHHHNDPDIQIFVPSKVRSEKNKGSLSLLSKSADCSNSDALMAASLSRRKSSVPAGMLRKSVDFTNVSKVGKNKMSPDRRLTGSFDSKLSGLIGASSSKVKIITSSREEKKKSPPTILRTSPDQSLKKGKSTSQAKLDNPSNQASRSAEVLSLSEKLGSSLKLKSGNNAGRVVNAGRSNTDLGTGQKSSKVAPLRKLQMPSPKVLLSSPKHNVSGRVARALSSPRVSLSPRSSLAGVAGLNAAKNRGGKVTSGLMKRNETEQAKTENKIKKKVASNVQHKIEDKTTKKVANKQRMNKQVKEVSPDMVQEKTLYVIKMDTEDKHLESDLNERLDGETETEISPLPDSSMKPLSIPGCSSSSSSLTNEDEDEDDDEESEYSLTDDEELDSLDVEAQKKWIRRKVVRSESQDPQPVKLRFRRGKVIEIKSENEGPRKLKFRKRRSLGKDQNAKEVERRMSYRFRGEEGEVKKGEDDSEKVVLRHQDMDGKKDGQGGLLFNNVIEETASKLAETRKSKVKALVGAFETVISLQDGKPSSGNVNLGLFPAALT